ncbi:MAG: glucoamylase family protein [Planctomycetota bacterium]
MKCQSIVAGTFIIALALDVLAAQPERTGIRRSPETDAALGNRFTDQEAALLDEVQQACFLYFWREVGAGGLAKDRKLAPVASIAAVGFQLSALPIGVERGWITRQEGEHRARTILRTLLEREDNKKFGLYYHYLDLDTGGQSKTGYEVVVSTVDSALLMAGAIPAAEYFGGEIKTMVDRLLGAANWKVFATGPGGELSMGWQPKDPQRPTGEGEFLNVHWNQAGDEERLVYFLAAAAPEPDHVVDPRLYYRIRRVVKRHKDMPPFVVTPQGSLFSYLFSHCWIDYRTLGLDDPARLNVDTVPVDWFENSRRAVLTHRQRCLEQKGRFKTLADDRWGLSACAARDGYIVPEIQPNIIDKDRWYEGTVAPYAAVASIMFVPRESLAAIHAFRELKDAQGRPLIWRDPAEGGYGFVDAFNLDQGFVSDDYVGIDQGPMLLAIENARTGLIWRLFANHEMVRRGLERLCLVR